MKTLISVLISVVTLSLSSATYAQGQVEIEWDNPDKFSDVQPSNQPREKFRETTFAKLNRYMQKLASDLPQDSKLVMTVTDLDLAGHVHNASSFGVATDADGVRFITQNGIPKIQFSYQLVDVTGGVLQQGQVKLKDTAFLHNRTNRYFGRRDSLGYEKKMLKNWFKSEFEAVL